MESSFQIRIMDTHPDIILRGRIGNLVQRMLIKSINGTKIPVWWVTIPVDMGMLSHPIIEEEYLELYLPK